MSAPQTRSSLLSEPPTSYFSYRHVDELVAGICAGAVSTALLHPADIIKTRLQVDHTVPSTAAAIRRLMGEGGWTALYKGLSVNLVGNTVAWGLYFGLYDRAKAAYSAVRAVDTSALNALDHMACAAVTGAIVTALTNPLWVVKTRMFLSYQRAPIYRGLIDGVVRIYRNEGIRGLYAGFIPSLLGVSHGAAQLMTYEHCKKVVGRYHSERPVTWTPAETVAMAVVSKTIASVATYPYQTIRSRMQNHSTSYPSALACIRDVVRIGGTRALYHGVVISTLKVIPNAVIVFLTYEQITQALKSRAARRNDPISPAAATAAM